MWKNKSAKQYGRQGLGSPQSNETSAWIIQHCESNEMSSPSVSETGATDLVMAFPDLSGVLWSMKICWEVMRDPKANANKVNPVGTYAIEWLLDNWQSDKQHIDCALSLLRRGQMLCDQHQPGRVFSTSLMPKSQWLSAVF